MDNAEPAKSPTITIAEAAKMLGISRGSTYALARTGELPGVIKLGGRFVVSRSVMERVLNGEQIHAGSRIVQ